LLPLIAVTHLVTSEQSFIILTYPVLSHFFDRPKTL